MSDTAVIFDIIGRDRTSAAISSSGGAFNKFALGVAAGAAFAGDKLVNMAANFQQGMTRLVTGAGEAQSNMKLVSSGILNLAGQVGESTKDLAAGMYLVESAGFHGADGLNVLKVAAMGAKVGNADMATVADAVTTALNAYHLGADQAAAATNALIAAEGQGKTNLEALAGSLSTVAPIASVAHVSLNEVLGAMATMTGQGTDAASAATYLKQTIGQLSNPTAKAALEMRGLGLDSVKVSQNLGTNGLASTLKMLTDAIQSKMGPAGTVLIQQLQKAAGKTTEFQKVLANLPPTQQTYIGALANMVGGTKSMQAALELTGDNMAVFQHNTDVISEKVKTGGQTIEGWALVQKNFNQRMAEAKGTVEALGIRIGTFLLPYAQDMLGATMSLVTWFGKHKQVAEGLAIGIGVLAGLFVTYRIAVTAVNVATKTWMVATKAAAAAQWLLNVAMDANPVGLIILAIVALVGIFALLWTRSAAFRNFWIGLWGDIWGFLKTVGAWFAGPFVNFFVDAGKDIAAPFLWLWHNILDPMWQAWQAGFRVSTQIVTSFANLFAFIWVHTVGDALLWVWQNAFKPLIDGIAAGATWLYNTIIMPIVHLTAAEFQFMGDAAMWLWHNAIEPSVQGMATVFGWLYNTIVKPTFALIRNEVSFLGGVFKSVFEAIGGFIASAFSNAVGIVKGAINGIIGVINSAIGNANSIINTVNKVPGVNFPHIPTIPKLAQGGVVQVGEHGTEIVRLPSGSAVYPHGSVPADMASGSKTATLRIAGNGDQEVAKFLHALKRKGILQLELA